MDMPSFGPLVVAALVGLSLVFSGGHLEYAFGKALGRLAISVGLALPVYLIVRYGTARGRKMPPARQLNALCLATAGVWVLQVIAYMAVPTQMQRLSATQSDERTQDYFEKVDSKREPAPAPKVDWSQFTPVHREPRSFFDDTQGPAQSKRLGMGIKISPSCPANVRLLTLDQVRQRFRDYSGYSDEELATTLVQVCYPEEDPLLLFQRLRLLHEGDSQGVRTN